MHRLKFVRSFPVSNPRQQFISTQNSSYLKSSIRSNKLSSSPQLIAKMTLTTLASLEKSSSFTEKLPPDSLVPTAEAAQAIASGAGSATTTTTDGSDDESLFRRGRRVQGGLFTWLTPEKRAAYTFLAHSPAAVKTLGLLETESQTTDFQQIMSGERYLSQPFPWAQAYAGYQFGQWAGQLGDGRVVNLFEAKNPETGDRNEVQLKGAGLTPYSRFADGKAVVRSSIREFLASEAVHALGIPSTRALAITLLPKTVARRERIEPCAVVARMAPTWIRLGSFSFAKRTGGVELTQKLADYVIEDVFGGVDNLVPAKDESAVHKNKYVRLYREIVKRNSEMLAQCQVYGFMNGVLNTDNTSVYGLSMDYGPFAFMDTFDPMYTPNHDDSQLRYSYRTVPTSMWWNLVRLAEDLGELLGATAVGESIEKGQEGRFSDQEQVEKAQQIVSDLVEEVGKEYRAIFQAKWDQGFQKRLGLVELRDDTAASAAAAGSTNGRQGDHDAIFQGLLDVLEECSVDFNQFFRALGSFPLFDGSANVVETSTDDYKTFRKVAGDFLLPKEASPMAISKPDTARRLLADWLLKYKARLESEGSTDDGARKLRMNAVNPKFVLKNWVVEEVITRVQNDFDVDVLKDVLKMALNPFEETWGLDAIDEMRFTGEVPSQLRDQVCSCSS